MLIIIQISSPLFHTACFVFQGTKPNFSFLNNLLNFVGNCLSLCSTKSLYQHHFMFFPFRHLYCMLPVLVYQASLTAPTWCIILVGCASLQVFTTSQHQLHQPQLLRRSHSSRSTARLATKMGHQIWKMRGKYQIIKLAWITTWRSSIPTLSTTCCFRFVYSLVISKLCPLWYFSSCSINEDRVDMEFFLCILKCNVSSKLCCQYNFGLKTYYFGLYDRTSFDVSFVPREDPG